MGKRSEPKDFQKKFILERPDHGPFSVTASMRMAKGRLCTLLYAFWDPGLRVSAGDESLGSHLRKAVSSSLSVGFPSDLDTSSVYRCPQWRQVSLVCIHERFRTVWSWSSHPTLSPLSLSPTQVDTCCVGKGSHLIVVPYRHLCGGLGHRSPAVGRVSLQPWAPPPWSCLR